MQSLGQNPVEGLSYETYDPQTKCPLGGNSSRVGHAKPAVVWWAWRVSQVSRPPIRQADLARLDVVERKQAQQLGLPDFKFSTNRQMLEAVGYLPECLLGSGTSRR